MYLPIDRQIVVLAAVLMARRPPLLPSHRLPIIPPLPSPQQQQQKSCNTIPHVHQHKPTTTTHFRRREIKTYDFYFGNETCVSKLDFGED